MLQRRLNFQAIRQRLAAMNMSMEAFKTEVGIDKRTIERLMSGKTRHVRYATVARIATLLQVEPEAILLLPASEQAQHDMVPPASLTVAVHLPVSSEHLVGRDQVLVKLNRAWHNASCHIFSIVAWAGVGKSTLVHHWLGQLARDGWRGAQRVFGWTFYSQGLHDTVTSADSFIDAALRYFDDPAPEVGTPQEKGQRLARYIAARRTLLILDGLEPLQYPTGPQAGKLIDPAMATLLRNLALHNPGLCIITTRAVVTDLAALHPTTVQVLHLNALSERAGAALLRTLGVSGTEAERHAATREWQGHALALHLLGTYLRDVCGGDIRRRHDIAAGDDWSEPGGQVWRVVTSYEHYFGYGPEVAILRLLGLFDRPAAAAEVDALRAAPAIPGLNETLLDLSEHQWQQALRRLRSAGLLSQPDPQFPHTLDAHPLIREFYRHQLQHHVPAAWQVGHARLYRHLQHTVWDEQPDTMPGLLPLYAAVTHGCFAGYRSEALQLFRHRIRRGSQQFSIVQLGAFGADMATLSHFFAALWSRVMPDLAPDDQLFLFHAAGECLSALGQVFAAEEPLQKALTLASEQQDWGLAATTASKLSEVYRARGDFNTALHFAKQSTVFADHPGVPAPVLLLSHAFLGIALHWAGQYQEAQATFQVAEQAQHRACPARPLLHAVPGYMYVELLLDHLQNHMEPMTMEQFQQEWAVLYRRITCTLSFAEADTVPRDLGLQHLSMGRLWLLAWEQCGTDSGRCTGLLASARITAPRPEALPTQRLPVLLSEQAQEHLEAAVRYLRQANHWNYLPRGLLTRAALYRMQNKFEQAQQDVQESMEIAQSNAMEFYQVDACLENALIHLQWYRSGAPRHHMRQARTHLRNARECMQKMGYYRRARQVAELDAWLSR